ncbi:MAG: hypothetical protein OK454_00050 [Thaumarchaeota archaeon]|nr:hypothetical protein [Nitrososphaerota archaeon]
MCCEKCGWKELVAQVLATVKEKPAALEDRQQRWIEDIALTVDDDKHCSDHQKKVVRQILKEAGIDRWRLIPKALDKTKWSDAKKKAYGESRKMSARLRRHGGF